MASDTSINNIAGLILSAGASQRMGSPKALLKTDDGKTLLTEQIDIMRGGGIGSIGVVLGAGSKTIIDAHPELDAIWIENLEWRIGQFSSIQSGLRRLSGSSRGGIILLPVDVVGVESTTILRIIEASTLKPHAQAIIPQFKGRGGHPIYLSHHFCDEIVSMDPSSKDARLDRMIRESDEIVRISVDDPAIARNINTPDEWRSANL